MNAVAIWLGLVGAGAAWVILMAVDQLRRSQTEHDDQRD